MQKQILRDRTCQMTSDILGSPQFLCTVKTKKMENIPYYIGIVFAVTTLISIFLFYRAARQSKTVAFVIVSWLLIQAAIGLTGFYTVTDTMPPRFLILISVPVLMIVTLFITRKGRAFLDMLDLK